MKQMIVLTMLIMFASCGGGTGDNNAVTEDVQETPASSESEQFNGHDVVYLTADQKVLWEGSYMFSNTTCATETTMATIVILEENSSTAQISIHYENDVDRFTGTFVDASSAGIGVVLMWEVDNYNGTALTDDNLVSGSQMFTIQFAEIGNLANECKHFFVKQ